MSIMIRMLTMGQLPEALALANGSFDRDMAPYVPAGCTTSFHAFASGDMIRNMMQAGQIHLWGAFDEQNNLVGVSSMNQPYHVSMLCVKEEFRRQGISRMLLDAMSQYGAMPSNPHPLTINGLSPAIPYLEHVGFRASGPQLSMGDVSYLPMQKGLIQTAVSTYSGPVQNTVFDRSSPKMPGWLKAVVALICVLAFAIFVYAASLIISKSAGLSAGKDGTSDFQEYMEQFNNDQKDEDEPEAQQPDNVGIEQIPAYTQKDLSYELKDQAFSETEKEGKYSIKLDVHYPQIEGLEEHQDKINQMIKDFALATEKQIYETPDAAQKKKVLELDAVYVYNEVTYKVTYAADSFISIVFNDVSLLGDSDEDGVVQVRTLNLDLQNEEVFKPDEVFDIQQDAFRETWEKSMISEAGDSLGDALPEFSDKLDQTILSGQEEDYPPAFFVDLDGVEIGFSILNQEGKGGWVTGPIPREEIVKYKTDSHFWELVNWK